MATEMRKTGVDAVGDVVSWGAHFCLFYETKEDLLDALISYCKSGLESDEYCLWIVAEPITVEEAKDALRDALPNFDQHVADSRLEIVSARDFFLKVARLIATESKTLCLRNSLAYWLEALPACE